jgi:hypothetical protein
MFRFLLILVLIFFIVKFFAQFFLKVFLNKMQNNGGNQQSQYNQKKEGEVTINTKPNQGKKIDKDEGDYIDYEEIKE